MPQCEDTDHATVIFKTGPRAVAQNFFGPNILTLKRATVFCLGQRLSKQKNDKKC